MSTEILKRTICVLIFHHIYSSSFQLLENQPPIQCSDNSQRKSLKQPIYLFFQLGITPIDGNANEQQINPLIHIHHRLCLHSHFLSYFLQPFIHCFLLLIPFFLSYPSILIPLSSWISFSSFVCLSSPPVSLSLLYIFFQFFIEVVTSVSPSSPASIFLDSCILLLLLPMIMVDHGSYLQVNTFKLCSANELFMDRIQTPQSRIQGNNQQK